LHRRACIASLYASLREIRDPILLIENKLLYKERSDAPLPPGYTLMETAAPLPTTVLAPEAPADLTVVAFGRMSVLAEQTAGQLIEQEEIVAELIFPLSVWPLDTAAIVRSTEATGRLLIVEEGAAGFDLASEVIAAVATRYRGSRPLRVRRVAAHPSVIPGSIDLERQVLPERRDIFAACLELFDD